MPTLLRSLLAGFLVLLLALPCEAQDRDEARSRFQRGVELFDEGHYDQALIEFQRAYELAPNPTVLFNIAQVYAALGDSVRAVDAYQRYLADARSVDPARRREVEREIDRQESRTARLDVRVDAPGARVSVDDVEVGQAPLDDHVRVTLGSHVVSATAEGRQTVRIRVEVAGGDVRVVEISLPAIGSLGAVRIDSALPGVEVRIDDRVVGTTPLDATAAVEPGEHRVVATRPGYLPYERTVHVMPGSELRVPIDLQLDRTDESAMGVVEVRLPDAEWTLAIDGVEQAGQPARLTIPAGPHEVRVDVAGRERHVDRIDVPQGASLELRPTLRWSPDGRSSRAAEADALRTAGWVLTLASLPVLGAGIGLLVWNITDFDARGVPQWRSLFRACAGAVWENGAPNTMCDEGFTELGYMVTPTNHGELQADLGARIQSEVSTYNIVLGVSLAAIGLGGAALVTGVILLLAAPSDEAIDRAASARIDVGIGPGSLSLRGAF